MAVQQPGETASRYGAPSAREIEKAAALLDYMDAA